MKREDVYKHGVMVVSISVRASGITISKPAPLEISGPYTIWDGMSIEFNSLYITDIEPYQIMQPLGFGVRAYVHTSVDLIEQAVAYCIARFDMTVKHELAQAEALVELRKSQIDKYANYKVGETCSN